MILNFRCSHRSLSPDTFLSHGGSGTVRTGDVCDRILPLCVLIAPPDKATSQLSSASLAARSSGPFIVVSPVISLLATLENMGLQMRTPNRGLIQWR